MDLGDVMGLLVGIADAMNHGDGGKNSQHPKYRGHDSPAVEQRAQNNQHDALGPLHETDFATPDQRFGAGAGVADHDGGDHHEGDQHNVEETVSASVVDQQPKEQGDVGIAVDYGIEKRAEDGDLLRLAGNAAVYHVENAGADDDETGVREHFHVILRVCESKQKGGSRIDDQPHERQHIGRNTGQRQPIHNLLQDDATALSECACPCH